MKPRTKKPPSHVRWFAQGFALGAAGASVKQRKGKPRLRAMEVHWRAGIKAGLLAASCFIHAYALEDF